MTHELKPNDYLLFPAFPQFEENKKKTKINVFQTFPQKEKIKYFIKNMLLITQITLRIVVRVQIPHHG